MAARDLLDDKHIKEYKLPEGASEHELKDGGNLQLRVRRGVKGISYTWEFQYKLHGKKESIPLGSYPDVTIEAARFEADKHRPILAQGKSPKEALKDSAAVEHAKALATAHGETPTTLRELFERWASSYLKANRKDGGVEVRRTFEKHILSAGKEGRQLGDVRLDLFEVTHVTTMMDTIRDKGVQRTCGVALANLRQLINWAHTRKWMRHDPTKGLKASEWEKKKTVGDRVLKEKEIVQLIWRLRKSYLVHRWKHAILFILSVQTRAEETMLIKREHIDLKERTLTIPVPNQKQVQRKMYDHIIHLSDFSIVQLEALMSMPNTHTYLFPGEPSPGQAPGSSPAEPSTLTKAVYNLNGHVVSGRRCTSELLLKGGAWSPHDLRRSGSTLMGELGVSREIVELCINHHQDGPYHHAEKWSEMKKAWDLLGEKLTQLCAAPDPEPHYEAPKPKYQVFDATDPVHVSKRKSEEALKQQRKEARAAKAAAKAIDEARATKRSVAATRFKPKVKAATTDYGDSDLI